MLDKEKAALDEIIELITSDKSAALNCFEALEVLDFTWEKTDRDWFEKWKSKWIQKDLFYDLDESKIVQKVPYHFNAPVEDLSLLPGRLCCDCA